MTKKLLLLICFISLGMMTSTKPVMANEVFYPFSIEYVEVLNQYYYKSIEYPLNNATQIEIFLPQTPFTDDRSFSVASGLDSNIYFSSYSSTPPYQLELEGVLFFEHLESYKTPYGHYILESSNHAVINNADTFNIQLMIEGEPNLTFLRWLNYRFAVGVIDDSLNITLDHLFGDVTTLYYFRGESWYIDQTNRISGIPDKPINPIDRFLTFRAWVDINNSVYDFNSPLTSWIVTNESSLLSASMQFQSTTIDEIEDNTIVGIDNLLTLIGFNNFTGKTIILIAVILLLNAGMVAIKLNSLIHMITNLLVTALFIYLGWLPIYMVIILILTIAVGFIIALESNGGGAVE